jgi:DNA-binding transcriptional LysR family regulator
VDQLDEVLTRIRSLLSSAAVFDPATSQRTFTVVCCDYTLLVLIGPLLHELDTIAPNVRVTVLPQQAGHVDLLDRAQCDLVLWPASIAPTELSAFPSAVLLTDEFVGVVAEDHLDVGGRLSVEQLSTLPYVQVADPILAPLESHFSAHDLPRNVVATTETFTSAAHMLPDTRMYTVVQRRLFDRFGVEIGLRAVDLDIPVPPVTESMYWHPRVSGDPAHRWLRTTLLKLGAHLGRPTGGPAHIGTSVYPGHAEVRAG